MLFSFVLGVLLLHCIHESNDMVENSDDNLIIVFWWFVSSLSLMVENFNFLKLLLIIFFSRTHIFIFFNLCKTDSLYLPIFLISCLLSFFSFFHISSLLFYLFFICIFYVLSLLKASASFYHYIIILLYHKLLLQQYSS